jgi:hypothetical protein
LLVTTPRPSALAMVFANSSQPAGRAGRRLRSSGIAIAAIVSLTVAMCSGHNGSALGGVFTLIKVTALTAIILGSFLLGHGAHLTGGPVPAGGWPAVASVI